MKTRFAILVLLLCAALQLPATAAERRSGQKPSLENKGGLMSLSFREAPLAEVFEMLSRKERVNIMLARGVTGTVTVNLYDVDLRKAIYSIANSAGYAVEQRSNDYVIVERKEAGLDNATGNTQIRSFKVQYSNPKQVADILTKHLSRYGKITPLNERNMLIVEDLPDFIERVQRVLREVDMQPRQILIEAKILEITLDDNQSFGIDWTHIFSANGVNRAGTQGLATRGAQGFFFNFVNSNIEVYLNALSQKGRIHTLATPRLLAMENQEAITKIGDNIGYKVTTTINNVSTESVQFLETGVILRVIPSVDEQGRVLMKIHPEVSSGSFDRDSGAPKKRSTEVTTQMLAEDGQSILIGGLIKRSSTFSRSGVPLLSDIPFAGWLFSTTNQQRSTTETVVLITPHILKQGSSDFAADEAEKIDLAEKLLVKQSPDPDMGSN